MQTFDNALDLPCMPDAQINGRKRNHSEAIGTSHAEEYGTQDSGHETKVDSVGSGRLAATDSESCPDNHGKKKRLATTAEHDRNDADERGLMLHEALCNIIYCSVCCEIYREPKSVAHETCNHSYCSVGHEGRPACIELRVEEWIGEGEEEALYRCRQCGAESDDLRPNLDLAKLCSAFRNATGEQATSESTAIGQVMLLAKTSREGSTPPSASELDRRLRVLQKQMSELLYVSSNSLAVHQQELVQRTLSFERDRDAFTAYQKEALKSLRHVKWQSTRLHNQAGRTQDMLQSLAEDCKQVASGQASLREAQMGLNCDHTRLAAQISRVETMVLATAEGQSKTAEEVRKESSVKAAKSVLAIPNRMRQAPNIRQQQADMLSYKSATTRSDKQGEDA